MVDRDKNKLWEKVKKTVKPLESNRAGDMAQFVVDLNPGQSKEPFPKRPVGNIAKIQRPSSPEPKISYNLASKLGQLDESTRKKISKGRLEIDARIDLHDMTQIEAYSRLSRFLDRAYEMGNRTVLVITGKGFRGEGVLRNAVPRWLNEPAFRRIVSGYHEATLVHGGSGALYVRVRRKK